MAMRPVFSKLGGPKWTFFEKFFIIDFFDKKLSITKGDRSRFLRKKMAQIGFLYEIFIFICFWDIFVLAVLVSVRVWVRPISGACVYNLGMRSSTLWLLPVSVSWPFFCSWHCIVSHYGTWLGCGRTAFCRRYSVVWRVAAFWRLSLGYVLDKRF